MTRPVAGRSEKLTLSLSIGGIVGCLEIEGAQPVFLEQVRARYGAFILPSGSRGASDFSLRLELDPIAACRRPQPWMSIPPARGSSVA